MRFSVLVLIFLSAVSASAAKIGLLGPDRARFTYEKIGDTVRIRKFPLNTVIELTDNEFRVAFRNKLAHLRLSDLRSQDKTLLERYARESQEIDALLDDVRSFRGDKTEDSTMWLKATEDKIKKVASEASARIEIDQTIDSLLASMESETVMQILQPSVEGTNIAFATLLAMAVDGTCRDLFSLNDDYLGQNCFTSGGFRFEGVREGWRDRQTGLTWFHEPQVNLDYFTVNNGCNRLGRRLPSLGELRGVQEHGIQEVPTTWKHWWSIDGGGYFWTSELSRATTWLGSDTVSKLGDKNEIRTDYPSNHRDPNGHMNHGVCVSL